MKNIFKRLTDAVAPARETPNARGLNDGPSLPGERTPEDRARRTRAAGFQIGERVIVNTGGADVHGVVDQKRHYNDALDGCLLISWPSVPDAGKPQWISANHVFHLKEKPDAVRSE